MRIIPIVSLALESKQFNIFILFCEYCNFFTELCNWLKSQKPHLCIVITQSQNKKKKMKKIKNLSVMLVLAVLMLAGIQSCSQYPDNNGITLVSRVDRVAKTWKVDNYKVNGVDYTSLVTSYTETYTKDGVYSYQWAILGGTVTWTFQNNDAEIRITGVSNMTSRTLFILKLENTEFWYYYMDGVDKKEFHLIRQ